MIWGEELSKVITQLNSLFETALSKGNSTVIRYLYGIKYTVYFRNDIYTVWIVIQYTVYGINYHTV